jgi:uncharacterized protein
MVKDNRAWQRMLSGRRLDLINPSPVDVELEDIAHGLSRVARWNGQTSGQNAFSVAEHCLLVEEILTTAKPNTSPRDSLAALLHDAPEYVIGDLISPFKRAVGLDYKTFEYRLLEAIHLRFGLPAILPKSLTQAIKRADQTAAYLEATQLAGFAEHEARKYFGQPREGLEAVTLNPQPPEAAKLIFINRFNTLLAAMEQGAGR